MRFTTSLTRNCFIRQFREPVVADYRFLVRADAFYSCSDLPIVIGIFFLVVVGTIPM
jgi:hypothetical protein